jgi:hypothetical protein
MEVEVLKLSDLAPSFVTRSRGHELAKNFRAIIEKATADTIVVGWDGVRAVSPSFIDEFVGGIREVVEHGAYHPTVVFTGDDRYIIELIDTILRRREFPVSYALRADDVEKGTSGTLGHPTIPWSVQA